MLDDDDDDDDSVFAAMCAGARGYVLKGAQQDEIIRAIRAIRAVAAGEAIFGPGIARRVLGLASAPPSANRPIPWPDQGTGSARPHRRRRPQRRDRYATCAPPTCRRERTAGYRSRLRWRVLVNLGCNSRETGKP